MDACLVNAGVRWPCLPPATLAGRLCLRARAARVATREERSAKAKTDAKPRGGEGKGGVPKATRGASPKAKPAR